MKFKKLNELLSVSLDGNFAQAKFRAGIPSQEITDDAKKVLSGASLYYDFVAPRAAVADNVEVPQSRPVLTDDRYVYANFRALSQTHLVNRGLDFTTAGVLEAATPMLFGKTVYPNHDFTDINNWVGVVSKASWDAAGAQSEGVAGINCEIKVDAYLNYRIACGVMMTPPAINAMSLTVLFEFEYSHPQMAIDSKWKFFDMLGEEVDGEIVRLIVTRIVEIWEASLVFLGEDRFAKGIDGDATQNDEDLADLSAKPAAEVPPPNSNEERKMKLNLEQKKSLGIEFDGEEVPETVLLVAGESLAKQLAAFGATKPEEVAELRTKAEAGEKFIAEKRADVVRLAKLAELGAETGELDPVVQQSIDEADYDRLVQLGTYFKKKVGEKFPEIARSSKENSKVVENAGGVNEGEEAAELKEVGVL